MSVAPEEYATVTTLQQAIDGDTFDIDKLEKVMVLLYQQKKATLNNKKTRGGNEEELAMVTFVGRCNQCKQYTGTHI